MNVQPAWCRPTLISILRSKTLDGVALCDGPPGDARWVGGGAKHSISAPSGICAKAHSHLSAATRAGNHPLPEAPNLPPAFGSEGESALSAQHGRQGGLIHRPASSPTFRNRLGVFQFGGKRRGSPVPWVSMSAIKKTRPRLGVGSKQGEGGERHALITSALQRLQ